MVRIYPRKEQHLLVYTEQEENVIRVRRISSSDRQFLERMKQRKEKEAGQ